MKQCPNCGSQIADDSHFCNKCGMEIPQGTVCPHCGASVEEGDAFCHSCGKSIKEEVVPTDPQKKKCSHCGASVNDGDAFCQSCGKSLYTPQNKLTVYDKEGKTKSSSKKSLPYILGAIGLIALCCGGWWLFKNMNPKDDLETSLVSFKKTAPSDNYDVEVEINIDYPMNGDTKLKNNITDFIIQTLNNDFTFEEESVNPHYEGDKLDGQAVVDYYGEAKIKEFQVQGVGNVVLNIRKDVDSEKYISYKVSMGGSAGGSGIGLTFGTTFNKSDGSIVQVINNTSDGKLKDFLKTAVTKEIQKKGAMDMLDKSELETHPFPKKAPYLTEGGVCFIYQKYEIGAGAMGEVELTIPYSDIHSYLSETALSLINNAVELKSGTDDSTKLNGVPEHNGKNTELKELPKDFSFINILDLLENPSNSISAQQCGLSKLYEDTDEKGNYNIVHGYDVTKGEKNTVILGYDVLFTSTHAYYFNYTSAGEESFYFCFRDKEDAKYIFEFAKDYGLIKWDGTYFVPSSKISSGIEQASENPIGEKDYLYSMSAPEEMDGKYYIWIYSNSGERKIDFRRVERNADINNSDNGSSTYNSSNTSSSSRTFANEQSVTMYLVNQSFRDNDGLTIRFDGSMRMYIDGDYAGVVSVLRYSSTSALLRYGGGLYGEGKITVQIVGDKLRLTDILDGTVYYQR